MAREYLRLTVEDFHERAEKLQAEGWRVAKFTRYSDKQLAVLLWREVE